MSLARFEYFAPESLAEAIALFEEKGRQARILAGGTDLMVKIAHKILFPTALISLKKVNGLDKIEFDPKNGMTIGAMALLADVAKHPDIKKHYPAVAAAAQNTANVQVRNMGTVVGNLCNASPSADNAPALLCLDALVNIIGPRGERQISLVDFFRGPGVTALEPAEIVTAVKIPPPLSHCGMTYNSLSARGKLDCSAVGVAALVVLKGDICRKARIVIGACAPVPMRAERSEEILTDTSLDDDLIRKAAMTAGQEAMPISDLRATADYRLKMVNVLTMRVLFEARRLALG